MQKATLGSTSLEVTKICLGTMTWGNGQQPESDAHAQMDYALAQGITFWDTAEMYAIPHRAETYGLTETFIGNWFKKTGRRNEVTLATKAFPGSRPHIRGGAPLTAKTLVEALEGSLKRLQTSHVELYQLHFPTRPYPHHQNHWEFKPATNKAEQVEHMHSLLQTAGDMVKAGKIRAFGLSNESAWGLTTYLQLAEKFSLPRIASVQNEYSMLYRMDDGYMEEICSLENIAFLPYSPLTMGILTGKYQNGARPQNSRILIPGNSTVHRYNPTTEAATDAYLKLAQKHNLHPAHLAIAWTLQRPFVTSTIIGATTLEQLKVDIAAKDVTLAPEVLAEIKTIQKTYPLTW